MNKIRDLLWIIFIYPFVYVRNIYYKKYKIPNIQQKMMVTLYEQNPHMEGSVGIGYKDGKLYDYLQKRYVRSINVKTKG